MCLYSGLFSFNSAKYPQVLSIENNVWVYAVAIADHLKSYFITKINFNDSAWDPCPTETPGRL